MEEQIPKIIHYCWFGGKPLPNSAIKYMETWRKYCPDYKIVRWDERRFDITSVPYVKEAYENEKWAFVTDYIRLYVLYKYGGIYMDTDVEVLRSLDCFLDLPAFSGFENENAIPTGIMGSQKNNQYIKYLLSYYVDKHFALENQKLDMTTNVAIITAMTREKYNIKLNGRYQNLNNEMIYFPKEYFCPKDGVGVVHKTDHTHTIHHFNGSWLPKDQAKKHKRNFILGKYLGEDIARVVIDIFDRD